MSIKIKGSASGADYEAFDDYMDALSSVDEDNNVTVLFYYLISEIFEKIKRETAYRGQAAEEMDGGDHLDKFFLAEGDETFFLDKLKDGAQRVFQKMFGFAKGLYDAFQFNVMYGAEDIVYDQNDIPTYIAANALHKDTCSVSADSDGVVYIRDTGAFTANTLVGKTVYVYHDATGDPLWYGTIASNTDDRLYVEDEFDWSGLLGMTVQEYFNQFSCGYIVPLGDEAVVFYIQINEDSRYDQLLMIDKAIEEALTWSVVKEWYRRKRMMDDYAIESASFEKSLGDIKSGLIRLRAVAKRKGFFDHSETTELEDSDS